MRKMKITSLFAAALLVAAGVSSCSDDNGLQHTPAAVGDAINFGVGSVGTRTTYGTGDGEDQWQLYWNYDADSVRLFSNEANGSGADYAVKEDANHANDKKWGVLAAREGTQMTWGQGKGETGEHTFYATYPGSAAYDLSVQKYGDDFAVFKCPINRSQKVNLGTKTDGNYSTTADMREAFMVASATGNRKTTDKILFNFSPIMTTLEVTVSRSSADNTNTTCTLTGLQVIANVPEEAANSDYFYYKVPSSKDGEAGLCDENGTLQDNTKSTSATTTTFVDIQADTTNCVELEPGESVTLTVFLPPMVNMKGVKLRVATAGTNSSQSVTATINSDIPASSKKKIKLPAISGASDGNNWITNLNDKIYVQQLSIPGTHDAAACTTSLLNAGRTQTLTPEEQFNMGIRAFDLRAAYREYQEDFFWRKKEMWLYHGLTSTDFSLDDVLSMLKKKLTGDSKGEFVILQFRHESEGGVTWGNGKRIDKWNKIYDALKKYDDIIVQWKPDLTIGECRGKMIIFTRDDYENRTKAALITGFGDNNRSEATLSCNGRSSVYYVQDYYNTGDDGGKQKLQYLYGLYDTTWKFNQATNNFPWALNHTSGYAEVLLNINGTTQTYMKNASNVNNKFYQYVTSTKQIGPTGIVFMDFVGSRTVKYLKTTYNVYGDLLPAAIIDQNYRCRLLRKN